MRMFDVQGIEIVAIKDKVFDFPAKGRQFDAMDKCVRLGGRRPRQASNAGRHCIYSFVLHAPPALWQELSANVVRLVRQTAKVFDDYPTLFSTYHTSGFKMSKQTTEMLGGDTDQLSQFPLLDW
jgi:hypothetical protein